MLSSKGFQKQQINCISYNPDNSYLALATNKGIKIFSTQPQIQLKRDRDFGAPIQIVEMINKSNLLAMVGYKQTPFAPPNKLAIYDDNTNRFIADLSFKSPIKHIVIRQNKIVVSICNKVYVIGLFSMEIQHVIDTFHFDQEDRYKALSLSNNNQNLILAAPGLQNGQVLLIYFNRFTQRKVKAHQSILSAVKLTDDGQKLATTSQKGIQIRIFNTRSGQMIQEVRRGNQFANIYSLVWSKNGDWLAVSSDSHNVHVFAIKMTEKQKQRQYDKIVEKQKQNPKSLFYFMKRIIPYFDAQYSFANYKIEDYQTQMQTFLGFSYVESDNTLILMNNFGTFQRVSFNEKGKCTRTIRKNISQQ